MSKHGLCLFLLVSLLIVACGQENNEEPTTTPSPLPESVVQDGSLVYQTYCAECHGPNGEGQIPENPLSPDDTGRYPAPPHNDQGHTWHHNDDLILEIIRDGGMGGDAFYEMPPFGDQLTEYEMNAVLTFIKTMWTDQQRQWQSDRTRDAQNQDSG